MQKLDKIILELFSILMFLASILVISIIIVWVKLSTINTFASMALENSNSSKAILALAIVCLLCSIKGIFFESSDKKNKKNGVLMQNDNGKLMISRETIENLVNGVVKEFPGARQAQTRIALDAQNNVDVLVDLTVTKDVVIKELTANMQTRIKEAIKKTSDLEVNQVNVRIKNIVSADSEE